jgi:formylglycine-generating enzyme required for sulfatase activity
MTEIGLNTSFLNNLLVEIPSGEVELRDDRIKQEWSVKIKPFMLGKYPVTQGLYYEITGQKPSEYFSSNKPVETVSWKDAVIFCNQLSIEAALQPCYDLTKENDVISFDPSANGFRLPTEAEWQFACQGGRNEIRYDELDKIAWYKNNSSNTTHEVGLKKPNTFGIYDMLGNVWEWCSDIYDESVYGSYRVFRGGGWCDYERSVMATTRRRSHPVSFKIDDLGFRIARNIE